jgi:hypothetical protein
VRCTRFARGTARANTTGRLAWTLGSACPSHGLVVASGCQMTSFHLDFETTADDRREALAADEAERFQMRPVFRVLMVLLGVIWLAGGVTTLIAERPSWHTGRALLGIFLGSVVLYRLAIQPILLRRKISVDRVDWERVLLDIDDEGLRVTVVGDCSFTRYWEELTKILSHENLINLYFADGDVYTIPDRAFSDSNEREWFLIYIEGRRIMAH